MKTYNHVEDYLEVIAGKRDRDLKPLGWMFETPKHAINLARYDVNFIESVSDATIDGTALTDRQAELAVKIVLKYRRQLYAQGIDVAESFPRYRKPLRIVDRSRRCWIQDRQIYLRFPYDATSIQQLRTLLAECPAQSYFDNDNKTWHIDINEYSVNAVVTWAHINQFEIDDALTHMQQAIIAVEAQDWRIELRRNRGQLEITNAADSLLCYLAAQGLALVNSDLVQLADLSSTLGYTVSESLWAEIEDMIGADITVFLRTSSYALQGETRDLDRVRRYAQLVNRTPMVIYDPTPDNSLGMYQEIWGRDVVRAVWNQRQLETEDTIPGSIIWSSRVIRDLPIIPLLISHVGMLAGVEKQIMIQNSQKIIYFHRKLG